MYCTVHRQPCCSPMMDPCRAAISAPCGPTHTGVRPHPALQRPTTAPRAASTIQGKAATRGPGGAAQCANKRPRCRMLQLPVLDLVCGREVAGPVGQVVGAHGAAKGRVVRARRQTCPALARGHL